ncbi:SDR family oxidoreductase [Nocardia carnea]|uniref:SDR family oxidoreductase n=1 Tax=Nocardia carnea TaxID=37328 RepID=UPI0024581143|nr:NAD(P)H-binding protein [Nocardia carnea]
MRGISNVSAGSGQGPLHLLTVGNGGRREGSSPTGIVGRALARRLLAGGGRVRVLAEPAQAGGWPPHCEIVEGSVASPADVESVSSGVSTLFLADADPASAAEVLQAGDIPRIRRLVLLSSHGPEYEENYPPETWFWLAIEHAVRNSGIPATIIRPSAVMGAMLAGTYPATGFGWRETIETAGTVWEPYGAAGCYPFIHEEDLAAVAAAGLLGDEYTGMVLEAVGLPVSTGDRVACLAAALGREIDLVALTEAEARQRWRAQGWPDSAVDVTLYALQEYAARTAELTQWTLDQRPSVAAIIGRPPRTFQDWVADNLDEFR